MNPLENTLSSDIPVEARLRRGARLVLGLLDSLEGGAVELRLPGGVSRRVGRGPCVAHMQVASERVFDEILAKGDIGFAETWLAGDWETDDLPALLTLLLSALAPVRSAGLPPANNAASAVVNGVTLAVTVEPLAGLVGSTDT